MTVSELKKVEGRIIGIDAKGKEYLDLEYYNKHVDKCPYFDFITKPLQYKNEFDWSLFSEETKETCYEFQKRTAERMVNEFHGRGIIALDMGLGKTVVGCLLLKHYHECSCLIICPSTMLQTWYDEYENKIDFAYWDFQIINASSDRLNRNKLFVSFDVAKNHPEIQKRKWDLVMVDECQNLKNECQRSKYICPLMKKAKYCFLISGTPQKNRQIELWNALNALDEQTFNSREVFAERYCDGKKTKYGFVEENGSSRTDEIGLVLDKFMIRIQLKDVPEVNIPPFKRIQYIMKPPPDAMEKLNELEMEIRFTAAKMKSCRNADMRNNLGAKLQGLTSEYSSLTGEIKAIEFKKVIVDLVQNSKEEDCFILFTYHQKVTEILKGYFLDYFPVVIDGTVDVKLREPLYKKIRQGKVKVSIISIGVGGKSLNLIPGANQVIMCELVNVPAEMNQAEGRISRIGSKKDGTSTWLVLEGSADVKTMEDLQRKKIINKKVIDKEDILIGFEFEKTIYYTKEF